MTESHKTSSRIEILNIPNSMKLYKPDVLPIVNQEQKRLSSSTSPGALQTFCTSLFQTS